MFEGAEHRYQPAETMYELLTRHYAYMLCGTLSPFHKDWARAKQPSVADDDELIEMLGRLHVAEKYHCELT